MDRTKWAKYFKIWFPEKMENFNRNLNGIYMYGDWSSAICLFIVDETFKDDHQYKKKNILVIWTFFF